MAGERDVILRYAQKVKEYCDGVDTFSLKNENDPLPRNVGYFDVYHYCIESNSSFSHAAFKAYKTMDSFRYYENGWIQSVVCKHVTTGCILLAKVKYSYRLNLKPLQCWVAVDKNGVILSGHCECMAGQGEICSHVGAVLFLLEAWGRRSSEIPNSGLISCTDVLAKWLVRKMTTVDMASVSNICWDTARKQQAQSKSTEEDESFTEISAAGNLSLLFSDRGLESPLGEEEIPSNEYETIVDITQVNAEIDSSLQKLEEKGVICPMMAIREPFSQKFVPRKQEEVIHDLTGDAGEEDLYLSYVIGLYLASLYQHEYRSLSLDELRDIADGVTLSYTPQQIGFIESHTRTQVPV